MKKRNNNKGVVIPTRDEVEKAASIAITAMGCIVALKMVSTAVDMLNERRQNIKIKKLNQRVDALEIRLSAVEKTQNS